MQDLEKYTAIYTFNHSSTGEVTALFRRHKYFSSDPFLVVALAFLIASGSNTAFAEETSIGYNQSAAWSGSELLVRDESTYETYIVGGTVSGLASGNSAILQNNGTDDLVVGSNGIFTFDTTLTDGTQYDVSVLTQPANPNQFCSVTNGSGVLEGMNVSGIDLYCIDTYQLKVKIIGEGSVLSNPPGLDCGVDCSDDFIQDTLVTLTATPADGFMFDYWSGDCTGGNVDCELAMSAGRDVAAHFVEGPDVCLGSDLVIDNITFRGSNTYCHGSTYIFTSSMVIVEAAAGVTFESPEIFLMPGFWVIKGGEFHTLTPEKIDEACTGDSTCRFFELSIQVSDNYDGHIAPLTRHVYHFRSPAKESIPAPDENRYIRFGVVDHGAEASLNLGLSKVKGRTQPGNGEATECFTGPGTELSLAMATDDKYTDCIMEFDTDYYFSIENLDSSINGGYRFSFGKGGTY